MFNTAVTISIDKKQKEAEVIMKEMNGDPRQMIRISLFVLCFSHYKYKVK